MRKMYQKALALCALTAIFFVSVVLSVPSQVQGASAYTVNSTEDTTDGGCDAFVESVSDCTLREAIDAANANPGADTITFSIDDSFSQTNNQWHIPVAELTIIDPVTISGASVWDTENDIPAVKIENTEITSGAEVFRITSTAGGTQLSGLEIVGGHTTLLVQAADVTIGTNCDESSDAQERNVLHGADVAVTHFTTGAADFRLRGNYIGIENDGITPSTATHWAILADQTSGPGVVGFAQEDPTCSPDLQRNIIGVQGKNWGASAEIADTAQDIRISGNWIGIGADGAANIGDPAYDGAKNIDSTSRIVYGTNGDGVEDASEKNYIGNWGKGIFIRDTTSDTRISGNYIGVNPNQTSAAPNKQGIVHRMDGGIIGWCDTSINTVICSDNGTAEDQANIIGFGERGIRFDKGTGTAHVYGNAIGTSLDGTENFGQSMYGVSLRQTNTGGSLFVGGALPGQSNTIKHANIGVFINGQSKGDAFSALNNFHITNNTISENRTYGLHALGTELYSNAPGPSDGTITGNVLTNNSANGMLIEGSSPTVTNNTIADNIGAGILVRSSIRPDLGSYNHPADTLSPEASDEDAVAQPIITGNTIDGNTGGGIAIVDAQPQDVTSLHTDNTIGTNGSFDVQQDWYVSVRLEDPDGNQIGTNGAGAVLEPASRIGCTSTCLGNDQSPVHLDDQVLFGPENIQFQDATSWLQLTGHRVSIDGAVEDYAEYIASAFGAYQVLGPSPRLTFNGTQPQNLPNNAQDLSVETGNGVYRYNILTLTVTPRGDGLTTTAPTVHTRANTNPIVPQTSDAITASLTIDAPTSMQAFATSDTTIQWYALGNGEAGADYFLQTPAEDRIDLIAGVHDTNATTEGVLLFREQNLLPETSYCGRVVYALKNGIESARAALSCATTLAEGETFDPLTTPRISVKQELVVLPAWVDRMNAAGRFQFGIPFGFLIVFGGGGFVHAERKRRQQCSTELCRQVRSQYMHIGTVVAGILFAGILLVNSVADTYATNNLTIAPQQTTFIADDTVRIVFHVSNAGALEAEDVLLHVVIPTELTYDTKSVTVLKGRRPLLRTVQHAPRSFTAKIGSIGPGETISVDVDTHVRATEGEAQIQAKVQGENFPTVTSEETLLYIGKRPWQKEELQPFDVLQVWDTEERYMLLPDMRRALVTDPRILESWVGLTPKIIDIQPELLNAFPLSGALRPRPGTWLLTSPSSPRTFAPTSYDTVTRITADRVMHLYGPHWRERVLTVPDTLLGEYKYAKTLPADAWPEQTVINYNGLVCRVEAQRCVQLLPQQEIPPWNRDFFTEATEHFVSWFELVEVHTSPPIAVNNSNL